jgi:hypothetical protein
MYCTIRFSALSAVLILALSGCQSHQSKVDALQKEYDQINQQFAKDCSAEYLNMPPKLSPKCVDENKKMKDAWDQLQAERLKQ